jgi:hypothetical protein
LPQLGHRRQAARDASTSARDMDGMSSADSVVRSPFGLNDFIPAI